MRARLNELLPGPWMKIIACVFLSSIISGVLSGVITGHFVKGSIKHSEQVSAAQAAQALHVAQISGCRRNNRKQLPLDKNARANWQYNTTFQTLLGPALKHPMQPRTAKQQADLQDLLDKLKANVDSLTWTPLVPNCVQTPTAVVLPVRFVVRQPSKDDLTIHKDQ